MPQLSLHTPVGDLTVSEHDGHIVAVDWGWGRDQETTPLLAETMRQIEAYFDGRLEQFELPLAPDGTRFQRQVWQQMCDIPFGGTKTYGEIAEAIGGSARSVGTACGSNPIPVLIPCHRVLAANGLGGYSGDGGVETKVALLRLERVLL